MPAIVTNDVKPLDDDTSILVIESKRCGSQTVVFDRNLEVFVLAHHWTWDSRHLKAFTMFGGARMDLHRHLAEMANRPKHVGSVSINPVACNDVRMKNLLVRIVA